MPPRHAVMLTCAATGSTLSPSMSPHLPVTPDEIATQSIDEAKAGAAIIHLHARDPNDGRPTNDPAIWEQFIPRIRKNCDAIINMSASMGNTAEDRVASVLKLRPDIATVIVGSMNYGRFKKAIDQGISEFEYDWEKEFYGPASHSIVTQNTFAKIDRMIDILTDNEILMEFECYDVGHLYVLDHHLKKKKIKGPLIVQFLTGISRRHSLGYRSSASHEANIGAAVRRRRHPVHAWNRSGQHARCGLWRPDGYQYSCRPGRQLDGAARETVQVERGADRKDQTHSERVRHRGHDALGRTPSIGSCTTQELKVRG